jgi:protein TonB
MTAQAIILSGQDRRTDFRRWSLAAAIVAAAHFGLMASYLLLSQTEPPGAPLAPAVIVELAPLPVSPSSSFDAAPGPEMQEAQPPSEVVPQEEPRIEPMPKIETPAEIVLPRPEPVERKPEENPQVKTPEPQKVERQQPAPRSTAAPRSEHRAAERPAAPRPGNSEASRAAIAAWRAQVLARLQSVKGYPGGADGRGSVLVSFTVERSGRVIGKGLVRGSGNPAFDQEALAMVTRASPLPPVPAAEAVPVHLSVPINFARR